MKRLTRLVAGLAWTISLVSGLMLSCSGCQSRGFAIRPYLQNPTQTEITLMWSMAQPGPVEVRYGAGQALDQRAIHYACRLIEFDPAGRKASDPAFTLSKSEYLYEVRLAGLTPGANYRYQVMAADQKAEGTFRTLPDRSEPFTFVAYGDSRTGIAAHRKVVQSMLPHRDRVAFILNSGDLTDNGAYALYHGQLFGPLAGLIGNIPLWPALGNHEGDGVAYRHLFALPGNERWYSFDYANAHFVALDSTAGPTNRAEMLAWLEQDLAGSNADWKIVFYHHPSYDVSSRRVGYGRQDVVPLLRKYKVDLVLVGHCHSYQRMRPLFTAGENDDHPITHIVTGGGGASLHRCEISQYAVATAREYHFMLFDVDGGKLSARVLTPEGRQIDQFEIAKVGGRMDPAYLAAALPEEDFDKVRNLVAENLRGLALPALPQPGKPVTFSFPVTAGEQPMKCKFHLIGDDYTMETARANCPANGTTTTSVTIHASCKTSIKKGYLEPSAYFECEYQVGGEKGSVQGGYLKVRTDDSAEQPD